MADFDYRVPETWCLIPVVPDDSGWERRVAELLCDGQENRALLEYRLNAAHPNLTVETHQDLGVWVPDRQVPEVAAVVLVDLVVDDDGLGLNRSYYRSLLEPDQRTWCTVFSRHIEEVELPVGPALLVREAIAQRESPSLGEPEMVEEHTIYTVFPTGCSQALELMFWTPSLELGPDLAEDAARIVATLTVSLEGPVWRE